MITNGIGIPWLHPWKIRVLLVIKSILRCFNPLPSVLFPVCSVSDFSYHEALTYSPRLPWAPPGCRRRSWMTRRICISHNDIILYFILFRAHQQENINCPCFIEGMETHGMSITCLIYKSEVKTLILLFGLDFQNYSINVLQVRRTPNLTTQKLFTGTLLILAGNRSRQVQGQPGLSRKL